MCGTVAELLSSSFKECTQEKIKSVKIRLSPKKVGKKKFDLFVWKKKQVLG
jgi:hypothetical protein